ncbi:MAG: alpha-E domain-containing protein [Trueperaceae bacterium]|nr:alpha-E domain-containing protein [Trueperaceae bacterium]
MALLKSTSAYEAFRKRHRRPPSRELIADFLLLEPDFPRSLRYCLTHLDDVVRQIAAANPDRNGEVQRQAGWLAAQIAYCPDARRIVDDGEPSLDELLDGIAALSGTIAKTYFLID